MKRTSDAIRDASTRRAWLAGAAGVAGAAWLPGAVMAQTPAFPARALKLIVPFPPGGPTDIVARPLALMLSAVLQQQVVVDNKAGAGGSIAADVVAKSPPDGYNLLINAAAHSGAPAAYPNLSYDAAKDFSCVASFGTVPNVLMVNPSKGYKSLADFVAKAKEGNLTYGSAGVGSATHWAAERFRVSAGFKGTHVPFRGGPETLTEVMTGRLDFVFIGISSGLPFVQNKQLQALAVSSAKRSPSLPDIPTTVEAGYANSDYNYWTGLLVPVKTPKEIVNRLNAEVTKAINLPDVQAKLALQGVEPQPMTPSEMDAMNQREIDLNLKIAKEAGLKFN